MMHPLPPLISHILGIGSVLFFLLGLYVCTLGVEIQQKHQFLKDPPLVCINGMPRGFVHVRGKTVLGASLVSPLTQLPCCYYRTTISRWDSAAAGKFRDIFDDTKENEFQIHDGGGKILVSSGGAEFDLPKAYSVEIDINTPGVSQSYVEPSLALSAPPTEEHLRQYLAQHGVTEGNAAPLSGIYRLTEYCLPAGQETSVFGTCDHCYGPGIPNGSLVLCKDEHVPTFLISNHHELKVSPRLRLMAIACYSAGILMITASLAGALALIYSHFA